MRRAADPESWNPTTEQREMLQGLLTGRFGLRFHRIVRKGPVYILTRGSKTLQLKDPQDKAREPIFVVFVRGDIADGEVRGANVSMNQVARELSANLGQPVLDQTGLRFSPSRRKSSKPRQLGGYAP